MKKIAIYEKVTLTYPKSPVLRAITDQVGAARRILIVHQQAVANQLRQILLCKTDQKADIEDHMYCKSAFISLAHRALSGELYL